MRHRDDQKKRAAEDELQIKCSKAVTLKKRNKSISKLTNDHILIKDV